MAASSSPGPSSGSAPSGPGPARVEGFHGVYLLYCLNPRFSGRTYIGFTVDPERRLKQHNRGKEFGGARRTSARGPWAMVLIVHGFPNSISALRFEWAWQHPRRSRRLAHVPPKKSRERSYDYNLRLLAEMLSVGPWRRLPLTVRWLRPDVQPRRELDPPPPAHMPVVVGPVSSVKPSKSKRRRKDGDGEEEDGDAGGLICSICIEEVPPADRVQCLSDRCRAPSHLICLAEHFRKSDPSTAGLLPVSGSCPVCEVRTLWGDLVLKKKLSKTYQPAASEEAVIEEEVEEEDGSGVDD